MQIYPDSLRGVFTCTTPFPETKTIFQTLTENLCMCSGTNLCIHVQEVVKIIMVLVIVVVVVVVVVISNNHRRTPVILGSSDGYTRPSRHVRHGVLIKRRSSRAIFRLVSHVSSSAT
jgi:hypothetical protein